MVSLNQPRGLNLVRRGIATSLLRSGDVLDSAVEVAASRWGDASTAATITRAAVSAGSATGVWGSETVEAAAAANEFLAAVREKSVFGQLALRRIPPRVRAVLTSETTTAQWRGEGAARPLTAAAFEAEALALFDLGVLCIVTKELLEAGGDASERAIKDDLVRAVASELDRAFLSADAGVANVKPAGICNGVTPSAADDLADAVGDFEGDLESAVWIAHPLVAAGLAGWDNPDAGIRGGSLLGAPLYTSRHAPAGKLILCDPGGIVAAEGLPDVRASTQATVEMFDNPTNASAPSSVKTSQVSLYQANSKALLVSQPVNWKVARAGSVSVLDITADS